MGEEWTDGQTDARTDGWLYRQTDGRTNGNFLIAMRGLILLTLTIATTTNTRF